MYKSEHSRKSVGLEETLMWLNLGAAESVEDVCHKRDGGSGPEGQQTE